MSVTAIVIETVIETAAEIAATASGTVTGGAIEIEAGIAIVIEKIGIVKGIEIVMIESGTAIETMTIAKKIRRVADRVVVVDRGVASAVRLRRSRLSVRTATRVKANLKSRWMTLG